MSEDKGKGRAKADEDGNSANQYVRVSPISMLDYGGIWFKHPDMSIQIDIYIIMPSVFVIFKHLGEKVLQCVGAYFQVNFEYFDFIA